MRTIPTTASAPARWGDLAGFASALALGMIAAAIAVESLLRLFSPITVAFGDAIMVAIAGLAVNLVSALLLSGGHHHHHGHSHHDAAHGHDHDAPHHDNNLRAAYIHVLADALTSILAIAALLAGRFLGWAWMDPMMGVVGAIVIARWSWGLLRDTAAVLLDTTNHHVADEVRALIEASGDAEIADLHVWRIGPQAHAAIVSIMAAETLTIQDIRGRLYSVHEIDHLTVEIMVYP